ncbi:helix-turn-helix domain-containing protein [Paenibacillus sp. 2TAB23]|uniref:helix-turn-helix domain-containing protein n=1 Tax=Paenibacillus sp. 2TAB23 TaxID=3233004 RepID=UPI003F9D4F6E
MLEPAMKIQIMNDSDNLIRIHLIHYKCVRLATNELNFAGDPDHSPLYDEEQLVRYASAAVTETLVIQLHQAFKEQSMLSHIKKQQLFCELLLHMHVPLKTNKQTVNESVQQTIAYMEEKFAKAIQMSDLPIMAGMTPSSYCRAFKKMTGLTPGHYLTRLRMMRAKELMSEPSAALRDVATSIGYQDELYFSRVFKKTEGISPSVYLKRRDRKIAVVSSYFLQDHLLALGILPIAAPSYPKYFTTPSGFPTYLHDRLSGTIPLNAERTIMTSDVMRLSPDMILKTEFQKNPNDQLWNANKNTIFIDPSTTWEHYLRSIAVRVQKEREAERIIRQMTLLEQETRKKLSHATKHGKWVIIRLLPNNCRLYGIKDHTFTELFYRRLQFKNDERITHSVYIDHALEQLFDLDPENILIIWSEETEVNELAGNERWQNLRAVKENRVYYPDSREWDPWGPIGREYMIRAMTRYFAKTGLTSSAMDQPDWQRSRSMV